MSETVITAGFALSRCFRAAARAAESANSTEWASREREAIDGLRVAGLFLGYHAGSPIARAITRTFTEFTGADWGDGARQRLSVSSASSPTPGERDTVAQIHTVRLVDDLTGGHADETIPFALDGKQYEIDLSGGHAGALRDALAPFIEAARSASSQPQPRARGRARAVSDRSDSGPSSTALRQHNQAVRAWARQNGYTVSERGRIPAEVVSAYQSATATTTTQSSEGQSNEGKSGAAVHFSG
ncbi:histone-like nucleoid-structuring protein Lsr2 [Pseudonocardia parietis]|uniref:Lsr2 protein n=1 Tax=Pseudonocardia parietis TaxID=570936 RepID=A0ABS4W654_9PSEU|nr:hypothetical protein [Pseudonocardia parietis]